MFTVKIRLPSPQLFALGRWPLLPGFWTGVLLLLAGEAAVRADAFVRVSGTNGVAELRRADLDFNFQDGAAGVDGLPFQLEAYGRRGTGVIYDGKEPPALSEKEGTIVADYGGKFSVTVRWSKEQARLRRTGSMRMSPSPTTCRWRFWDSQSIC